MKERLSFSRFVDWAFLAIITTIVSQGASQIGKLSNSIQELNQKMAVAIEKLGNQDHRLNSCEERLGALEKAFWRQR